MIPVFIKLTLFSSNHSLLLNIYTIEGITTSHDRTNIRTSVSEENPYQVVENPRTNPRTD